MKHPSRRRALAVAIGLALSAFTLSPTATLAQDYPTKPITMTLQYDFYSSENLNNDLL